MVVFLPDGFDLIQKQRAKVARSSMAPPDKSTHPLIEISPTILLICLQHTRLSSIELMAWSDGRSTIPC